MGDWYLQTGPNRYGPYTWEQVKDLSVNGRLQASDLLWHSETNQWRSAGEFCELFPQPAPPPRPQSGTPKTKKHSGCGCLTVLGVIAAIFFVCIAGLVFSLIIANNRPSSKMTIGKPIQVTAERIDPQGDVLSNDQPGDPLDGFMIDVPPGAYDIPVNFKVSYHPIEAHDLGSYFTPITPLIHVDNGGDYASKPMTITLPVPEHPDYFTMAFFYDRKTGQLEGMPLIDAGDGTITLATRQFSYFVASTIRIDELQGKTVIDTGFRPGYDDWQFTNYGSWATPSGHCAGQAISAMWYFYERRVPGERPLYGHYDNNDRGYGTIDFWQDDSWGYRLATAVQKNISWDAFRQIYRFQLAGHYDHINFLAFAYAMLITEMPQFVWLNSSISPGGHAIIAYRLEQNLLYVADPNFPGDERAIHYENNRFLPYNSGDNANAIAQGDGIAFDKIGYFATTAMVDWNQVGLRWSQLEGGSSANDYFYLISLYYLSGEVPDVAWSPMVDGLSITEEETALPGNQLRGRIRIKSDDFPSEAYEGRVTVYQGTQRPSVCTKVKYLGEDTHYARCDIRLQEGVNDLGFLIEQKFSGNWHYVDFQRFIIIYDQVDLTGEWQGHYIINEADKLTKLIEDAIVSIVLSPVIRVPLENLFEITIDEAKAREATQAGIETPGVGVELPFVFTIADYDDKSGDFTIWYTVTTGDGIQQVLSTKGKFEQGILSFTMASPEGFNIHYDGRLVGSDQIRGTFSSTLFGLIKDVMSGTWEVERLK